MMAEVAGAFFAVIVFTIIFPMKLKEKCDPFECPPKKPIQIDMGATSGEKCSPFECPQGKA
jgi:hypothetical protein